VGSAASCEDPSERDRASRQRDKSIFAKDSVSNRLFNYKADPDYLSQQAFAAFVVEETAKWRRS